MARIRNDSWKDDMSLKEQLLQQVRKGLQRDEILSPMRRDFPSMLGTSVP